VSKDKQQHIKIDCADKTQLAATLYTPEKQPKGAILFGPATGIKRQFYTGMATFLAENGYAVLTFDNRGIGESLNGTIKQSDASLQCWGEQDMPAALNALQQAFPDTQYHFIGHSAGGQLLGLMHNAHQLSSIYNYACSSGSLRNMKMPYYAKAQLFMNVFIPVSNLIFGHTKSQLMGMGEPLPSAAASQWRQWCNGQGYIKTVLGKSIVQHYYDDIDVPSMWVNATDDDIAITENVRDMISVFSKMQAQTLTLHPQEHDLKEIGHMRFFSRKSQPLWQHTLDWLAQHTN